MNQYLRYYNSTQYLKIHKKAEIKKHIILLESQKGKNINGNIFYLIKELTKNFQEYRIYVSVEDEMKNSFLEVLNQYQIKVNVLIIGSRKYFEILSTAKYLFTDTSFFSSFIKKEHQILTNVWHGTPLKKLGKSDNREFHSIGNVQKNFFLADYLLYPNVYMMNHMVEDYMLENICEATCLIGGYPRNEIFFQEKNREIIRTLKLENKQIIAYMPTYRGTVNQIEDSQSMLEYLEQIDLLLNEDQILLVNFHPFVQIKLDKYLHIYTFPSFYETYDVLNCCDVLITDYSSVLFDFVITKRKIVLFPYDLIEYTQTRGLYLDYDEFPFPKVDTINQLIDEINSPKLYSDKDFIETYCKKDNESSSKQLIERILKNKQTELEEIGINNNRKENILIYAGNLAKNGITTALLNLMNHLDIKEKNYFLTFHSSRVSKNKSIIKCFPSDIKYIPILGKTNASLFQKIILKLFRHLNISEKYFSKIFDDIYFFEFARCFGNIVFDHLIFFNGYEYKKQLMFGRFKREKTIFIHSNMIEEIKNKNNQHTPSLRYAYQQFNHIAIVTEDMKDSVLELDDCPEKIVVVHNVIDYEKIIKESMKKIIFDESTISNVSINKLNKILSDQSLYKFINVGRFSAEKGHKRLMDAFNQLYLENQDIYLIIIGGYGVLYEQTVSCASSLEAHDHIILINSISNPYPIIKQCNGFVLSSFYEGFGLVLAEADILGLPVVSTNILGPRSFMEKYNGKLVENSEEGLFDGMNLLLKNKIKPMKIDYQIYNKFAISQFKSLL